MALAALKTWVHEKLFASDLNAEFANIRNNALTLISPLTGNLDAGGHSITNVNTITSITGRVAAFTDEAVMIIAGNPTESTNSNNAVEAPHYALTVPANTLKTNGFLHGSFVLYINSILNTSALIIRVSFGGTTFFTPILTNTSGATLNQVGIICNFRINGRSSTGSQVAAGTIFVAPVSASLNFGVLSLYGTQTVSLIGVDSTINRDVGLTTEWNVADAANSVTGLGMDLWQTR